MQQDGLAPTVPLPVPTWFIVRVVCTRLNVAVADLFPSMVTLQEPVPEQAPDHPLKVEPVFGVAVKVTTVP